MSTEGNLTISVQTMQNVDILAIPLFRPQSSLVHLVVEAGDLKIVLVRVVVLPVVCNSRPIQYLLRRQLEALEEEV